MLWIEDRRALLARPANLLRRTSDFMQKLDFMGEAIFNQYDRPAYPYSEAARYLSLPAATLRSWFLDYTIASKLMPQRRAAGLIKPASAKHLFFLNLVEAHVLAAIGRAHRIAPDKVRGALKFASEKLGVDRPFRHTKFGTDGIGLFVDRLEGLIEVSSQGPRDAGCV